MSGFYPIRFKPILRQYVWGGRRLGDDLGKPIGKGSDYAESWELVDHGEYQSVAVAGPWSGVMLRELVAAHGEDLLGQGNAPTRFPLLLKFLDAQKDLSVQVHPDDACAAKLDTPDLGKTEAWVILDAQPGSRIYAGLNPDVDRPALERALAEGTCESCLHAFEPKVGDCILIPAGVVHAIGSGILLAEIQQASDTTYRLFDWGRMGTDGKPRELHVDQALDAIDFGHGPVSVQQPQRTDRRHVQRLVACDKFVVDRWDLRDDIQRVGGNGRFHILAVIEGSVTVAGDPVEGPLKKGGTVLLPASIQETQVEPRGRAVVLDVYLPQPSRAGEGQP